jgi:hypothetical protein
MHRFNFIKSDGDLTNALSAMCPSSLSIVNMIEQVLRAFVAAHNYLFYSEEVQYYEYICWTWVGRGIIRAWGTGEKQDKAHGSANEYQRKQPHVMHTILPSSSLSIKCYSAENSEKCL